MTKTFRFIGMVLMAVLVSIGFTACSSDDDNEEKEVRLADGMKTEQVVYADETNNGGITFTADAAWTATVRDASAVRSTGGSSVEWLTLSQYSGNAGTYTLTLTLTENMTGSDRKAVIEILCGSTTISVTVEQKATREDGTIIKRIKEISCEDIYEGSSENSFVRTFSYDEQGRVARIVTTYPNRTESYKPSSVTATFDYDIVGEIGISIAEHYPQQTEDEISEYRAILNEQGNATVLQEKDGGSYTDYIKFSYTADGYLKQWKDCDEYSRAEANFAYTNDYFTQYTYKSDIDSTTVFDFSNCYPHSYKNSGQLDFMAYLYEDDDFDFLFYIGRLGRVGKYMPETLFYDYGEVTYAVQPYTEPNVTIHKTYSYAHCPGKASVSYAFDSDDNLTTIKAVEPYTLTTIEYDAVVGNELIDSNYPYHGYKYTVENRTEKTEEKTNTKVFTIKY